MYLLLHWPYDVPTGAPDETWGVFHARNKEDP